MAGAGLPGLILASGGLLGWWRRRRRKTAWQNLLTAAEAAVGAAAHPPTTVGPLATTTWPCTRSSDRAVTFRVSTPLGYLRAGLPFKEDGEKERKMAEQYVEQLAAARERMVADRRELADELAKPYERGRYEQWRRIIEVQATIDAIDRAITDERSIKDKGKPVSLVDLG